MCVRVSVCVCLCVSICIYIYWIFWTCVHISRTTERIVSFFFYNIADYNWTRQKTNEKYFTKR